MSLRNKILKSNIDFNNKTTKDVSIIFFGEIKSTYVDQISAIFKQENIKYKKTSVELLKKRIMIKSYFEKNKDVDKKSAKEWAQHFSVGVSLIFNVLKELNIRKYKRGIGPRIVKRSMPIKISDDLNQIIIGSLLGDGHVCKHPGNINSNLCMKHGKKQRDYVIYKRDLVSKHISVTKLNEYKRIDKREKWPTEQFSVEFATSRNQSINKYRDEWYPNGIKIIPRSVKSLTPLALAIWYMDDGNKSVSGYNLATMCFSKDDVNFLKEVLYKNFGIESNVYKNNTIYIKANSRALFTKIVKPFFHKSMLYKLHTK